MKILFLFVILLSGNVYSATCTTTSRNNYVTNQVLTSSALNTDFNQLVTKANAFDGGCITDGTLEDDALNAADFAPMLKGIKEGCKVSYSSATQISIGKCLAAVNGSFVTTTTATTAAFGCTSCSAEVASTTYYAYIQTGSAGSTLTPLILTTAPNEDGYDNSGNKVLAKFYNNASSDIDQYSIDQWHVNGFVPANGDVAITLTPASGAFGTISNATYKLKRIGSLLVGKGYFTNGTVAGGTATIDLPAGMRFNLSGTTNSVADTGFIGRVNSFQNTAATWAASNRPVLFLDGSDTDSIYISIAQAASNKFTKGTGSAIFTSAGASSFEFSAPITGWND